MHGAAGLLVTPAPEPLDEASESRRVGTLGSIQLVVQGWKLDQVLGQVKEQGFARHLQHFKSGQY